MSRQRLWGVPLPLFVEKVERRAAARPGRLSNASPQAFEDRRRRCLVLDSDPQRFLGNEYNADDYEQIRDVVEVWFDSGSTHSFVLEARPELAWPASLYLEGSDQHRGWFHTSLLQSAGTRGRAPYDAVLTHGFVLDKNGMKMAKSLGNVVLPEEIIEKSGADILRLWVVASNYEEDIRIGDEILRYQADAYRRLRNTLRYLIGNLAGFRAEERLPVSEMPELERWVLHRLHELDRMVRESCENFDFHEIYQQLHTFCAVDLSAFYFDIRKDSLYCDRPDATRRRACRTVLDHIYSCLTAWLAPIICFTAEEAWWARANDGAQQADGTREASVHLRTFPEIPAGWHDTDLAAKWARLRDVRRVVTGAIELERAEKRLGSSLEAHPRLYVGDAELRDLLDGIDLAELTITSGLDVVAEMPSAEAFTLDDVPGIGAVITPAQGQKCQRCWRILPDVGDVADVPDTCPRCADAVVHLGFAAA